MKTKITTLIIILTIVISLFLSGYTKQPQTQPPLDPAIVGLAMNSIENGIYFIKYGNSNFVEEFVFIIDLIGVPIAGQVSKWKIIQLGRASLMETEQLFMLLDGLTGWKKLSWTGLPSAMKMFMKSEILFKASSPSISPFITQILIVSLSVSQIIVDCPNKPVTQEYYNNKISDYNKKYCRPAIKVIQ